MRFQADLHMHTDPKHGDDPKHIAKGIVASGIDVYAVTEHRHVSDRAFDVAEEVGRLLKGTERRVLGLVGVEMNLQYEGGHYHVGRIFESDCRGPRGLPNDPPKFANVSEYQAYVKAFPGVSILFHPAWHDAKNGKPRRKSSNDPAVSQELLKSGLLDGAEIANGMLLLNGAPIERTEDAVRMFLEAKRLGVRLAAIGCSDAHKGLNGSPNAQNFIGSAVTQFCSAEMEGIFAAIREGNTKAVGRDPEVRRRVHNVMNNVRGAGKYMMI